MNNNNYEEMVKVKGILNTVKFRSNEGDFIIGTLSPALIEGQIESVDSVNFKGNLYGVEREEKLILHGKWEYHDQYGKQLKVISWERPMPNTKEQVIAFLASNLVKGCGKKQAIEIYNKLGERAVEIINDEGESALDGIKGFGQKKKASIVSSIRASFEVQKTVSALLVYGITANVAMKAYKEFGSNTLQVLKKNPYELIKLDKIGFLKADEIALKMGILSTSSYRIDACLDYVLKKMCYESGHCFVSKEELCNETLLALNHRINEDSEKKVTYDELLLCLDRLEGQIIVQENDNVYPKNLYKHELKIADTVYRLLNKSNNKTNPVELKRLDTIISNYENKNRIKLAIQQINGVKKLFSEQFLILTGGPGTGKTTVTKAMIDIYLEFYPKAIIKLAAPTGRASRRLAEVTGLDASTIHSLIGWRHSENPEYNQQNPLVCDLLVIDEMSMTDITLASLLLEAVHSETKVLFVGDIDQLPSVGPGNVLRDLINANVPTVRLTEVFRQAQESQIISNAHRINKGYPLQIDTNKKDFYFIENQDTSQISDLIVLSVKRFLSLGYSISDILVLSPMRGGDCGVNNLNEQIRKVVNPPSLRKKEIKILTRLFREGDKVIQVKNNAKKDLSNGDIGIIRSIGQDIDEDGKTQDVVICEYAGREVAYLRSELDEIELAFAITIHKSQGGESPIVIIPSTTSHYIMLARNLMYTGLTRAKEIMVFVGTMKAMNVAIANNAIVKRNSKLTERIQSKFGYTVIENEKIAN